MQLIFIYGPPAAGKHTVAVPLSEQTGIPLFHNHMVVDIVRNLFEFGSPPFIELRERLWLDTFTVAAEHDQSMIFTFNPEATVAPTLIADLFDIINRTGGSVVQVELLCPDEVVESRLNNESRHRFTKLTDVEVYREVRSAGGFEFDFEFRPDLQIDTTTHTPDEAVASIIRHLA